MTMIAVKQHCVNSSFIPLGIVMGRGEESNDRRERLTSFLGGLRESAPKGTTHLFSVKWEVIINADGLPYFSGTADAYKAPKKKGNRETE